MRVEQLGPLMPGWDTTANGRDDIQYEPRVADKAITNAIDTHVQAEQPRPGGDDGGATGVLVSLANGPDGI